MEDEFLDLACASEYSFENSTISSCDGGMSTGCTTLFQAILVGYATLIVCIVGIFGNVCTGLVLCGPKMKSCLNCLLIGLTICDLILIINTIIIFSVPALSGYHGIIGIGQTNFPFIEKMTPYLYAIGVTAQTGSVYFVIAVTIERFIAVCHPLYARMLCTWSRAKYYTCGVLLFSIIYNIPRWNEFVTDTIQTVHGPIVQNQMTKLRCDPLYITIYIQWANFVVMILFPIVILVVFNSIIFAEIRRSNSRRQELSQFQSRENSLAMMLLIVVLVFLICSILPFVNNFMESMKMEMSQTLVDISNFMVALNSSVNCFIYCIFGAKFRKHLISLLLTMFPCFSPCVKKNSDSGCHQLSSNTIRINFNSSARNCHASSRSLIPPTPPSRHSYQASTTSAAVEV